MDKNHKKRGNNVGFWFLKISLIIFGLRGTYGLLYFVCLYYLMFDRKAAASSLAYIKRRYRGNNILRKKIYVYLLFVNQGKFLIDRYYLLSHPEKFEIEIQGYEKIEKIVKDPGKGLVLLTAHIGNWQVCMSALQKLGKTVYLLMRPEDNPAVKDSLNIDKQAESIKIISPDQLFGGVIEMTRALEGGNLVSIMGDRAYGFESVEVSFLGDRAYFPFGAYSLGASVGCPVVILSSAKVAHKKYTVSFSNYFEPRFSSRKNKFIDIKSWVGEFADFLEEYVNKYPLQWFAFYDLWAKPAKTSPRSNPDYS